MVFWNFSAVFFRSSVLQRKMILQIFVIELLAVELSPSGRRRKINTVQTSLIYATVYFTPLTILLLSHFKNFMTEYSHCQQSATVDIMNFDLSPLWHCTVALPSERITLATPGVKVPRKVPKERRVGNITSKNS